MKVANHQGERDDQFETSPPSRCRPSPDGWAEAAGMGAQLTERDAVEDLPRRVEQLESACARSLLRQPRRGREVSLLHIVVCSCVTIYFGVQ
jgi:plasmid stabilization system protein ParE